MKTKVQISAIVLLTALSSAPAHAMLARLSQAAVRSNAFTTGQRLAPLTESQPLLQPNLSSARSTLLARTLAAQHAAGSSSDDYNQSDYNQSGHANNSQDENQSWWQRWRSRFTRDKTAPALGFSLFGYHVWWSEDDICSKPEDFQDPKKIARMQKYFDEGESASRDAIITRLYQNSPSLTNNDQSIHALTQFAYDNFTTLVTACYGRELLYTILKKNISLEKKQNGLKFFNRILTKNSQTTKTFTQPACDNFATLATDEKGLKLLLKIISHNPQAAIAFMQPACDNFVTLATDGDGQRLLMEIISHNPLAPITFTQPACDNFATLATGYHGKRLLKKIIKHNPQAATAFESLATKHNLKKLQDLIARAKLKKELSELFADTSTQTTQHFKTLMKHNLEKLETFFPKNKNDIDAFKDMVSNIIATERQEQAAENYTFVHAYPWNIRFLQDIDAHLRAVVYKTKKQPVSLRFTTTPRGRNGEKHLLTRKELVSKGVDQYYARSGNKQKHMIFMNYALLTNQHGSNTLQYIAKDRCENPPNLLLDKVFKHLDIEIYHTKYQQEFKELQALHREASMFGAGILFSFTPEMLQESVYVCYGGGAKRKVRIEENDGTYETDDVKLILDTLRTTPKKINDLDHLEFVFVVTKDCGLNPRVQEAGGVKIIPFNAADPEKLALYEQKRDELMAKIKADIDAERAAWNEQEKLAHETTLLEMDEWYKKYNCLNDCEQSSRVQEAE